MEPVRTVYHPVVQDIMLRAQGVVGMDGEKGGEAMKSFAPPHIQKAKNPCGRMRKPDNPYEIWETPDGSWKWYVLKKWQLDDNKPYARWFCMVYSPFVPDGEMGDVYVADIKGSATMTFQDPVCLGEEAAPVPAEFRMEEDVGKTFAHPLIRKAGPLSIPDLTGKIMAYEDGNMSEEEMVMFFQELVDTGLAWKLQGMYGRMAARLIDAGLVTPAGAN